MIKPGDNKHVDGAVKGCLGFFILILAAMLVVSVATMLYGILRVFI